MRHVRRSHGRLCRRPWARLLLCGRSLALRATGTRPAASAAATAAAAAVAPSVAAATPAAAAATAARAAAATRGRRARANSLLCLCGARDELPLRRAGCQAGWREGWEC